MLLEASSGKIHQQGKDIDVLLFYEITQRKKTEIALEQSTERYKSLVENSPNGIFILVNNQINSSPPVKLEYEVEDAEATIGFDCDEFVCGASITLPVILMWSVPKRFK